MSELFDSPVRLDIPRPLPAAFFAEFSDWSRDLIAQAHAIGQSMPQAYPGPLVLIGPTRGGKSELVLRLCADTGLPKRHAGVNWARLWWQTDVVRAKAQASFGSRFLVQKLAECGQLDPEKLLNNWTREGKFSPQELDQLKLQNIATALSQPGQAVLEIPESFCIYSTAEARATLAQLFKNMVRVSSLCVPLRIWRPRLTHYEVGTAPQTPSVV